MSSAWIKKSNETKFDLLKKNTYSFCKYKHKGDGTAKDYEDICLLNCTKKGLGITRNIITKNSLTRSLLHFNGTMFILKPHD